MAISTASLNIILFCRVSLLSTIALRVEVSSCVLGTEISGVKQDSLFDEFRSAAAVVLLV